MQDPTQQGLGESRFRAAHGNRTIAALSGIKCRAMPWKRAAWAALGVLALAGCDSGGSESGRERDGADSPAARVVREFYDAANDSAGPKACALLTADGIRTVVHVATRNDCVRTINGLTPGSFESKEGELVEVEGAAEAEGGFHVDAVVKGRSEGVFTVIRRQGRLAIDGFESEEG